MNYIFIAWLGLLGLLHPIHVSKTNINYNTEQFSLQITAHIYLDDLEADLKKYDFEDLKLCTKYESPAGDSAVVVYIENHLKINIGDKPLKLNYLGKEISEDYKAAWIYLEAAIDSSAKISVENTILTDLYDDQKNLVDFKKDYERIETVLLDDKDTTADFSL